MWYIASYIQRFVITDEDNENLNKHFSACENAILLQANTHEEAYQKALKFGKEGLDPYEESDGKTVRFVFEGLSSLIPIYEELKDGAEILFREYDNKTLKTIRSWVKEKDQLEAFEDSE